MPSFEPTYHQLKKEHEDKPELCLRCKLFTHCAANKYKVGPLVLQKGKSKKVIAVVLETPPNIGTDLIMYYRSVMKEQLEGEWKKHTVVVVYAVSCATPDHKRTKEGDVATKYVKACNTFLAMHLDKVVGDMDKKDVVIVLHGKAATSGWDMLGIEAVDYDPIAVPYLLSAKDEWEADRRDLLLIRVNNTANDTLISIPDSPLHRVLAVAKSTKRIAVDFEWSPTTGKVHTVGFAAGKGKEQTAWAGEMTPDLWLTTKRLFADSGITIIGHDLARAEVVKMLEMGVREINCKFKDGLIRTWELREGTRKAALKDIVWEQLDLDGYWRTIYQDEGKAERKAAYLALMETPSKDVSKICRGDAYASLYYDECLDRDFPEQVRAITEAERLDHAMILPTAVMMHRGIGIDLKNVSKRTREIMDKLPSLRDHVKDTYGIDISAPTQVQRKLQDMGVRLWNTEAERLEEAKQAATRHDVEDLITCVLEFRNLQTLLSRYLEGLPQHVAASDGRIHSYIQIAKAVTGRMASAYPNIANIPKHVRDIFKTTFGKDGELWTFDRSQSEYRCVAYLSRVQSLIDSYMRGEDLHTFTGTFFAIPRRDAKNINFAGIFDATVEKLVYMLLKIGVDKDTALRKARDFVLTLGPIKAWQRSIVDEAFEQGYVETVTGRRSYRLRKQQIINTPVQGWSADLNKETVLYFFNEMWNEKLESYIWLEFYDGTEMDVYKPEAPIIDKIAKDVFQVLPDVKHYNIHLPFPVEKEVHGTHWKRQ